MPDDVDIPVMFQEMMHNTGVCGGHKRMCGNLGGGGGPGVCSVQFQLDRDPKLETSQGLRRQVPCAEIPGTMRHTN